MVVKLHPPYQKDACELCKYSNYGTGVYQCRRHAPISLPKLGYSGQRISVFPEVLAEDWCGDFMLGYGKPANG